MRKKLLPIILPTVVMSTIVGGLAGYSAGVTAAKIDDAIAAPSWLTQLVQARRDTPNTSDTVVQPVITVEQESAVIQAVEQASPAVVSVIVTKDIPRIEQYYEEFPSRFEDLFPFRLPQTRENGTERMEVGGGTGFIVSRDGYIVTNRHVVADGAAEYSVMLNNGQTHDARVLARDPVSDIAVLKIDAGIDLPILTFGDSDSLKRGQTAIAIGNALGEFQNTVSRGIISGLSRSIVAGGPGVATERLSNLIQTDAAINVGNSGGPLLNIAGQVIGMNTAVAGEAQNIGFAIPSNEVRRVVESVQQHGKIIRPWLGVRYIQLNDAIAKENNLSVSQGALVVPGMNERERAVMSGSPADKAGIEEGDIIIEVNGTPVTQEQPLGYLLQQYKPGDVVKMTVVRDGERRHVDVTLGRFE